MRLLARWKGSQTGHSSGEERLRSFPSNRPGIDAGLIECPARFAAVRGRGVAAAPHRRECSTARSTRHKCRAYYRLSAGTTVNGRRTQS